MGHKCFISFKTEDMDHKKYIQDKLKIDMIDKSLDSPINSTDENYIMQKIRLEYLSDSTVTIHLIGERSSENLGWHEQRYIKRELQGSLYNAPPKNTRSGILGIVLPQMKNKIFFGTCQCALCGNNHDGVNVKDYTIKEFSYNYYIPNGGKCSHSEDERYCVLANWDEFIKNPEIFIEKAYQKRSSPIANKVKVKG